MRRLALTLLSALILATSVLAQSESEKLRSEALALYKENKFLEALPLFEKLVLAYPADPIAHEGLAACLLSHSAVVPANEGNAVRARARREFLEAKRLGSKSDFVEVELQMLSEDGSNRPASNDPRAQAAMDAAEACFARRDMDCAISEYQKVLAIEPRNYEAALFIGDSYFAKKDLENSSKWFMAAIAIDPNVETAYRYWADALMQAGKQEQARERFVEAFITQPYSRASQAGLAKWARQNLVKLQYLRLDSPNTVTTDGGKTNINVNADTLQAKDDDRAAWLVCDMSRALWRREKFLQQYPATKQYRHSLAEELECLGGAARTARRLAENEKRAIKDPALALLADLEAKGLLESYILLNAPDEGIAQDFVAYRDAHRDKLRQYVNEYMLTRP